MEGRVQRQPDEEAQARWQRAYDYLLSLPLPQERLEARIKRELAAQEQAAAQRVQQLKQAA